MTAIELQILMKQAFGDDLWFRVCALTHNLETPPMEALAEKITAREVSLRNFISGEELKRTFEHIARTSDCFWPDVAAEISRCVGAKPAITRTDAIASVERVLAEFCAFRENPYPQIAAAIVNQLIDEMNFCAKVSAGYCPDRTCRVCGGPVESEPAPRTRCVKCGMAEEITQKDVKIDQLTQISMAQITTGSRAQLKINELERENCRLSELVAPQEQEIARLNRIIAEMGRSGGTRNDGQ